MEYKEIVNLVDGWFLEKFRLFQDKILFLMQREKWEIGLVVSEVDRFVHKTFSGNYLELLKMFSEPWDDQTVNTILFVFQQLLLLLYPAVPFVTNYLYKSVSGLDIVNSLGFVLLEPLEKEIFDFWKIDCCLLLMQSIKEIRKESPEIKKFWFQFSFEWRKRNTVFDWSFFLKKTGYVVEILEENEKKTVFFASKTLFPFGTIWYKKSVFDQMKQIREIKECLLECELEYKRCCNLLENVGFLSQAPFSLIEEEKRKRSYFLEEKEKKEIQLSDILKKKR